VNGKIKSRKIKGKRPKNRGIFNVAQKKKENKCYKIHKQMLLFKEKTYN